MTAAVPTRPAKPILANVLLTPGRIIATDLELRIETAIGYDGTPLLLPHARLSQIVASAGNAEQIEISATGSGTATITAEGGSWKLPTEDVAEYPTRPATDDTLIGRLPADQFRALLNTVRFATDNESSRYALGGVCMEYDRDSGTLYFVATDGRRMAVAECSLGDGQDPDSSSTLAPRRAVDVLVRLCTGVDAIELRRTANELISTVDGTTVYARLIDGRFPRWRDVDTAVTDTVAPSMVVVGELLHACEMAAVCTSEESRATNWSFTTKGLTISGQSAENGESFAVCELVELGHKTAVQLDPEYAIEWLRTLDGAETITVQAIDESTAVVFRAGGGCRQIVMPMLKD